MSHTAGQRATEKLMSLMVVGGREYPRQKPGVLGIKSQERQWSRENRWSARVSIIRGVRGGAISRKGNGQ